VEAAILAAPAKRDGFQPRVPKADTVSNGARFERTRKKSSTKGSRAIIMMMGNDLLQIYLSREKIPVVFGIPQKGGCFRSHPCDYFDAPGVGAGFDEWWNVLAKF
jgi:hypothetical protein